MARRMKGETEEGFRESVERMHSQYRSHFERMWPRRNEEPHLLPNGRDYTDIRSSLRVNIRGQRNCMLSSR